MVNKLIKSNIKNIFFILFFLAICAITFILYQKRTALKQSDLVVYKSSDDETIRKNAWALGELQSTIHALTITKSSEKGDTVEKLIATLETKMIELLKFFQVDELTFDTLNSLIKSPTLRKANELQVSLFRSLNKHFETNIGGGYLGIYLIASRGKELEVVEKLEFPASTIEICKKNFTKTAHKLGLPSAVIDKFLNKDKRDYRKLLSIVLNLSQ